jgi:UDP-glucuronate 4-epimerase
MVLGLEQLLIEEGLIEKPTEHELLPMQPGDVYQTWADTSELAADFGYTPQTELIDGLREFVRWYKSYYLTDSK